MVHYETNDKVLIDRNPAVNEKLDNMQLMVLELETSLLKFIENVLGIKHTYGVKHDLYQAEIALRRIKKATHFPKFIISLTQWAKSKYYSRSQIAYEERLYLI